LEIADCGMRIAEFGESRMAELVDWRHSFPISLALERGAHLLRIN